MKGIILAGGNGTRLRPLTYVANKHLLPVYNKLMIEYPIETLKSIGVTEIILITGGENVGKFAEYLGDGSKHGVRITYRVQMNAGGIAEALGLAKEFVGEDNCAVILGDNIYENKLKIQTRIDGAKIFLKECTYEDAKRFGCALVENDFVTYVEEKPLEPRSTLAITGLYIFDKKVFSIIDVLKPSKRGELEITDAINWYVQQGKCYYEIVDGFWSDAGTFDSLLTSANWIKNETL